MHQHTYSCAGSSNSDARMSTLRAKLMYSYSAKHSLCVLVRRHYLPNISVTFLAPYEDTIIIWVRVSCQEPGQGLWAGIRPGVWAGAPDSTGVRAKTRPGFQDTSSGQGFRTGAQGRDSRQGLMAGTEGRAQSRISRRGFRLVQGRISGQGLRIWGSGLGFHVRAWTGIHFGHCFAQVNIEVSRGHQRSNFQKMMVLSGMPAIIPGTIIATPNIKKQKTAHDMCW